MATTDDEDKQFAVEIDAAGVEPDNVDARRTLELVAAYFDLVARVAGTDGYDVTFRGISVVKKCVLLGTQINDPDTVRNAATTAQRYMSGNESVPQGLQKPVDRVKNARRKLPPDYNVKARIGRTWELPILADAAPSIGPPPTSITSLRVKVIRVGGITPRAKLASDSEADEFSVLLTEELARVLGHFIYKEVDVDLHLDRDADGNITGGQVVGVHPLDDVDTIEAWRDFYRRAASEWDSFTTIDEMMRELGRDD